MGSTEPALRPAVFLDRDGVLIEDRDYLVDSAEIRILEGVPEALRRLADAGFRLIVVSNQSVVARGLITPDALGDIHEEMMRQLCELGAPRLDAIYFCPHHPEATVLQYRKVCDCRKPRAGMFLRAAREHNVDLSASVLVGDRITDIAAGAAAGCRTVLVQTGKHNAPMIVTVEPLDASIRPDHTCSDLATAAEWILASPPLALWERGRG